MFKKKKTLAGLSINSITCGKEDMLQSILIT